MSMDFEASVKHLQNHAGTSQEEFDRMGKAILAMATEPQEYTDEQTGMRLTVAYDIPEHPLITVFPPEPCTLSIEEGNAAIQRLLVMAGLKPPEQAVPGGKP